MYENPRQVLTLWFDAVNTGDLQQVASLYAEDAIVLPTFSNKCLHSSEDRAEYFEKLAKHKELNVVLHEATLVVQPLSTNVYSMSGIYCWHFDVEEEMLSFEARFTFTVDPSRSEPILHHHSSQIPRML